MEPIDLLTIHEAASQLGKSPQTIRRMIKRGDIRARRVKTPQGFHYVIRTDELPMHKKKKTIHEEEELLASTLRDAPPIQNRESDKNVMDNEHSNLVEKQEEKKVEVMAPIQTPKVMPTIPKLINGQIISPDAETSSTEEKQEGSRQEIGQNAHNCPQQHDLAQQHAELAKDYFEGLKSSVFQFSEILDRHQAEQRKLFNVIERLQTELDYERKRPRSFFAYFMDWLSK